MSSQPMEAYPTTYTGCDGEEWEGLTPDYLFADKLIDAWSRLVKAEGEEGELVLEMPRGYYPKQPLYPRFIPKKYTYEQVVLAVAEYYGLSSTDVGRTSCRSLKAIQARRVAWWIALFKLKMSGSKIAQATGRPKGTSSHMIHTAQQADVIAAEKIWELLVRQNP